MPDIVDILNKEAFDELVKREEAVLAYFSHEECSVCKVLKPKIQTLLEMDFPKINMVYADTVKLPELAGQNSIFTVPSILVFFGGKEFIRVSRNIGVSELGKQMKRPYDLMFGD